MISHIKFEHNDGTDTIAVAGLKILHKKDHYHKARYLPATRLRIEVNTPERYEYELVLTYEHGVEKMYLFNEKSVIDKLVECIEACLLSIEIVK